MEIHVRFYRNPPKGLFLSIRFIGGGGGGIEKGWG